MTACVNSYEDRFLGNLDRRIGARTSGGSQAFDPMYNGGTARHVWRRADAQVEAAKATPAPRPVAPVVKKPAPVVAKVAEAEAPKPTERKLWELEQEELGRRVMEAGEIRRAEEEELVEAERREEERLDALFVRADARKEAELQKEKERQRRIRDAEKTAERQRQGDAAKRLRNSRDWKTGAIRGLQPLTPAEQQVVDTAALTVRIADLAYDAIYAVYDDKNNGLKWRFDSKKKLLDATKNPAGVKHVAAFVTACEEIAKKS